MKKTICIILAVCLCIVMSFILASNSLVSLEEEVNSKQSNIELNLQRRSDLIPNLVATVKGYTDYEEEVYTNLANARAALNTSVQSGDLEQMQAADDELSNAISRLLVIVEAYPDLKASEQFIGLQDELAGTENRIAFARKEYNEAVTKYNKKIRQIPTSIIASMAGFERRDLFEVATESKENPVIDFN